MERDAEDGRPTVTLGVTSEILDEAINRLDGDRHASLVVGSASEGHKANEIELAPVLSLAGG
ncbi:MAG: hypothetical protein ACRDGI_02560, partial [Candidatus Limnocylindrales bacterium]